MKNHEGQQVSKHSSQFTGKQARWSPRIVVTSLHNHMTNMKNKQLPHYQVWNNDAIMLYHSNCKELEQSLTMQAYLLKMQEHGYIPKIFQS